MTGPPGSLTVGDEVRVAIGAVAHGGHFVARHQGQVLFVRHTAPFETVLARVTEIGSGGRFVRADAVTVLDASPDRVDPPCPYAGVCGGCDFQHLSLPAQRGLKAHVVREQFARLAGMDIDVTVQALPGAPAGLGWRTRVEFAVGDDGRAGLRRHRSHVVVPIDRCAIAAIGVADQPVLQRRWSGYRAVDVVAPSVGEPVVVPLRDSADGRPRRAGRGRRGGPSGSAGRADQGLAEDGGPRRAGRGRRGGPSGSAGRADQGLAEDGGPRRAGRGRRGGPSGSAGRADQGLAEAAAPILRERVVDGEWEHEYEVSSRGFWQVHPAAAATLTAAVVSAGNFRTGDRVLDLYAGVGLFSARIADLVGPQGSVLAVESDRRAVAHASVNLAGTPWVEVLRERVEVAVRRLAREGITAAVVVLDPPRAGAGSAVVLDVAALSPRVIVYVACDPGALARDTATLVSAGYRLAGVTAYDAFPMTHHVECVAAFDRVAADARHAGQ